MIIRRLMVPLALAFITMHAETALAQGAFPARDAAFPPAPGEAATRGDPSAGRTGARRDSAFPPAPGEAGARSDPAFPPAPGQTVLRNDTSFPPISGAGLGGGFGTLPGGGGAPFAGGGMGPGPASPMLGAAPSDSCMKDFMPLRQEAERRSKMIKAASDRHAPPEEACKLIENFGQAELKMMKYVEANASRCGIPPQIHDQLKKGRSNTEMMQKKVCSVAQQRPVGPSLSEALGSAAALPEATPKKKGGSAFDTLTGNVLTR